jgi:hypothetical protein
MKWRAWYVGGQTVTDDDHDVAYATLDRSRMHAFECFVSPWAIVSDVQVIVPKGRRLVRRERVTLHSGTETRVLLVGTESDDRSNVDVWLISHDHEGVLTRQHLRAYGTDAATCPPQLYDFETVRG